MVATTSRLLVGLTILLGAFSLFAAPASNGAAFVYLRNSAIDAKLTPSDIRDFAFATKFIESINQRKSEKTLHKIPQPLDAFQIVSWFKLDNVGAAWVPTAVYQLLKKGGFLQGFETAAFLQSKPFFLVARRTSDFNCDASLTNYPFSSQDSIFLASEFHNAGQLTLDVLADTSPLAKTTNYTFVPDAEDQKSRFLTTPLANNARVYGVFDADSAKELMRHSDVCLFSQPLTASAAGKYLVADRFLAIPRTTDSLEIEKQLARVDSWYENHSIFPRLRADNVVVRLKEELKTTNISLPLMGSGARTPYLFMMGYSLLHALGPSASETETVLLGTSGGALNALLLSLADMTREIKPNELSTVAQIGTYIYPQMRSHIFGVIAKYPIGMAALLLVFCVNFLFLWRYVASRHASLIILATLALFFVLPLIQIEWVLLAGIVLLLLAIPIYLVPRMRRFRVLMAVYFCLNLITLVGLVKFPITARYLFKDFDAALFFSDFLKAMGQTSCLQARNGQELSKCLIDDIQRPLVLVAVDADHMETINFFVAPQNSKIQFPREGHWVNLRDCPEMLITAVQGSGAAPVVFEPVKLSCRNRDFNLVDGGLLQYIPLEQARALGIDTHVVLLHDNIELEQGLATRLSPMGGKAILFQFEQWVKRLVSANQRHSMKAAIEQTLFISQPRVGQIKTSDFWGAYMPDGRFVSPADLAQIAADDFHASPGVFTQIGGGDVELDAFYNRHRNELARLDGAARNPIGAGK